MTELCVCSQPDDGSFRHDWCRYFARTRDLFHALADAPAPPCCGAPQLGPVPGIGYYCHLGWQCAAPSPFTPEPAPSPALAIYDVMRKHGIVNRIIRVAGEEDRYETDAEALDWHLTGTS